MSAWARLVLAALFAVAVLPLTLLDTTAVNFAPLSAAVGKGTV